jgi:hypothetical protein
MYKLIYIRIHIYKFLYMKSYNKMNLHIKLTCVNSYNTNYYTVIYAVKATRCISNRGKMLGYI